jgi:hypothetical protein
MATARAAESSPPPAEPAREWAAGRPGRGGGGGPRRCGPGGGGGGSGARRCERGCGGGTRNALLVPHFKRFNRITGKFMLICHLLLWRLN